LRAVAELAAAVLAEAAERAAGEDAGVAAAGRDLRHAAWGGRVGDRGIGDRRIRRARHADALPAEPAARQLAEPAPPPRARRVGEAAEADRLAAAARTARAVVGAMEARPVPDARREEEKRDETHGRRCRDRL